MIPIDIFNNIAMYSINRYLMKQYDNREERGKEIAEKQDQIKRIDDNWYQVKSQSLSYDSWYDVVSTESGFVCDCPDHQQRENVENDT